MRAFGVMTGVVTVGVMAAAWLYATEDLWRPMLASYSAQQAGTSPSASPPTRSGEGLATTPTPTPPAPKGSTFNTDPLPVMSWGGLRDQVGQLRNPVLVDGMPTAAWASVAQLHTAAAARDTLCASDATVLKDVCIADAPEDFLYVDNSAFFIRKGGAAMVDYVVDDMACGEFFEAMEAGDPVVYFSRGVAKLNKTLLTRVNLWLGSEGTTARLHFDASANLFTQLQGRKRFLLAPPHVHHRLYLHSILHPLTRQAQFNPATNPAVLARHFPDFRRRLLQEVVLQPGQTLYLPPFYFHQVTALDASVAVNAYVPSPDVATVQHVLSLLPKWPKTPLPDPHAMLVVRSASARDFLINVLHTTHVRLYEAMKREGRPGLQRPVASSVNKFVRAVVQARWSHSHMDTTLKRPQDSNPVTKPLCSNGPDAEPRGQHFQGVVAEVVRLVATLPVDLQELVLADYVEAIAHSAVGEFYTDAFLRQCFPVAAA